MRVEKVIRDDIRTLDDLKVIRKEGRKFPSFVEGKVKKLYKGKVVVYVEKMEKFENKKISYYYNYWLYCVPCGEREGWYRIISDYELDNPALKNLIKFKIFKNYQF